MQGFGDGVLKLTEILDEAPAALVLPVLKEFPLALHLVVGFQRGAGLSIDDAVALCALQNVIHDNGVEACALQLRIDGDEQQIDGVVVLHGAKYMGPSCGEEPAAAAPERFGHRRHAHAEGDELLFLVVYQTQVVRADHGQEFFGVFLDLIIGKQHNAIQRGIGLVHQMENLLDVLCCDLASAGDIGLVIAATLQQPLGKLAQLLGAFAFGCGENKQIFHPIGILAVVKGNQMILVVGMIVIGDEHAALIKALYQHALAIQIAKTQGTMYLIAALGAGPIFHGGKERCGDLTVVNEIDLRKTHALGVPGFIGAMAEDRADAADDLAVSPGEKTLGLAVGESRVLFRIPVVQIVSVEGRDELRNVLIQDIGIIDKTAQVGRGGHFTDFDLVCCHHLHAPIGMPGDLP